MNSENKENLSNYQLLKRKPSVCSTSLHFSKLITVVQFFFAYCKHRFCKAVLQGFDRGLLRSLPSLRRRIFDQKFPDSCQSSLSLNMNCGRLVLLGAGVLTFCLADNKETTDQDDGHYKEGDSFFTTRYESHPHTCRKPGNCEVLYDSSIDRDQVIS